MNVAQAIEHRRSVKHYDPNHVMPEADSTLPSLKLTT